MQSFPFSLSYELTDGIATRAARERWRALGGSLYPRGGIVTTALAAILCIVAVIRHASLWWILLAGAGPVLLAVIGLLWLSGWWWFPRTIRRNLVRLAHRQVTIDFTAQGLAIQSAAERLEVPWSSVVAIRSLPSFWLLRLQGGSAIPIPRPLVSADLLASLRAAVGPGVFGGKGF